MLATLLAATPSFALTWRWSNPSPHGNSIVDMAWNGGTSVNVTELGQIYSGFNFFGWFPRDSGTTNDLQAVKYFGNRIVFCGANGTVGYSDDGVNFTCSSLNTSNWLVSMAVATNQVVAVGDNAVIYTTSDGATWQYRGTAPSNTKGDWLLGAAWGAGTFVIAGESAYPSESTAYLATSSDGITWTRRTLPLTITNDVEGVYYVSTTNATTTFPYTGFWAVTYDGKVIYSTNSGVTWHQFSGVNNTNVLYSVAANNATALLAGDSDVQLGYAPSNTIIWPRQTAQVLAAAPVWTYYSDLWNTNGSYQLAGDYGMMVQSTNVGTSFYWQIQYNSVRDWLWQVTLASDLYVAVGDHARIMTSQNGVDWSIEAVPETNSVSSSNSVFFGVGGNTNLLLAAGNKGSLAVSPALTIPVIVTNLDGTTFTNAVGSLGVLWYSMPAPTTNDLMGTCFFNNSYFLSGGNATLLRSSDGTNWSGVSVPTTNYISSMVGNTNLMVAVGDQGLVMTSPDGLTWTKRTTGTTNWLLRVRAFNGTFLAMGENGTIMTSTNGQNWSASPSGTTNWLNDATMVSNTCYIAGNNGTVLASTNFVNWTNVGTITPLSLYGASSQNGQLLVVGLEGAILRSPVIPDLNPLTIVTFTQSSGENIFLVAGDPDQEFTLDSSTNLVDWTTGPLLDLIYGSGTLVFLTPIPTNTATQYYRATLVP